jgi:hypothetical protein
MGLSAEEVDVGAAVVVVPEPAGVVDDVDVQPATTIAAHVVSKAIRAMLMRNSSPIGWILSGA